MVNRSLALLCFVPAAAFIGLAMRALSAPIAAAGAPPRTGPETAGQFAFTGAASCAAAACHGRRDSSGGAGSEYATWASRDRHARAYEALFLPRSVNMMKLLGRGAAHVDTQCLSCHVTPRFSEERSAVAAFAKDGVSCESCHGPAQRWLTEHTRDSWKALALEQKQALGMRDTQTLGPRIQLCVHCHVGSPAAHVDHELIAAGHPRLNFEFAGFHSSWSRHWPDARDKDPAKGGRRDFEARAWFLGQLRAARAALEILEARAQDHKPWLEFAELNCGACHRALQSQRRLTGGFCGSPGGVAWNKWYVALLPQAVSAVATNTEITPLLDEIGHNMAAHTGSPDIATLAKKARVRLDSLIPHADRQDISLRKLCQGLLGEDARKLAHGPDDVAQVYLALAAMHNAWTDEGNAAEAAKLRPRLIELRKILRSGDERDFIAPVPTPAPRKAAGASGTIRSPEEPGNECVSRFLDVLGSRAGRR